MSIQVPGLPEGVECIRIGIAGADDWEIVNDANPDNPPFITKGPRAGSMAQVIVQPAHG